MKSLSRLISKVALAAAAFGAFAAPASASIANPFDRGADRVVFVQTDDPAGNQVIAYDRGDDGTLTAAGTYDTGGLGGVLTGSVSDHLASQGSLTYDRRHGLLYAVNAGSDTITVFAVRGDRLVRLEVLPSGGSFPVSVTVHRNLVYVLNAKSGGWVQGYREIFGFVLPLRGSGRPLGLSTAAEGTPAEFVNTPGQVDFSPDGSQLVITTKANGSNIDVFAVGGSGRLSATPVVNAEPGAVPFAINWDAAGHLVIAEAGTSALATFTLGSDGTLAPIDSKLTGQKATCWVVGANGYFYASNTGSANISNFSETAAGILTALAVPLTPTDPGTVDASVTPDGRYLYVQTGINGIVDEFHTNPDGSLSKIGAVTVPGAIGGEGIVAA
jgi:6-phosphogluconolactonase (cycloisomerase 2 family)